MDEFESNEKIISIDASNASIKDDALLIDIMSNGNYFINLFITNPCTDINTNFITS